MYPLLACDLEGCINDVEHTYIMILNLSFNIFIVKKLFVAHKEQICYQEPFHVQIKAIKIWGLLSNILPNPRYSRYIFYPKRSTTSIKMHGDSYPHEVFVWTLTDLNEI
jgi:hypothetical protein